MESEQPEGGALSERAIGEAQVFGRQCKINNTTGTRGNTKTITVSFPVELAAQAERLAKTESRTMSELFREAFRTYRADAARQHGEQDVERMVDEARAELEAERRKRR